MKSFVRGIYQLGYAVLVIVLMMSISMVMVGMIAAVTGGYR